MAPTLFDCGAKPGDLIEIFRGTYKHWALYIGGDEVVHLTTHAAGDSCLSNLMVLVDTNKALVQRQAISEVVGRDRFVINNLLDDEYVPRERHVIVSDARKLVGQELPYSTISSNCEHFVTLLRYGKPESRQVKDATAAVVGAAVGIGILAVGAALLGSLLKDDDDEDDRKRSRRRRK